MAVRGEHRARCARRYARALLDAARATREEERVLEELAAIADLANPESGELAVPEFERALVSPRVPDETKRALLKEAASLLGLTGTTRAFLALALAKRRFAILALVVREYRALLDEAMGLVRARVETATPLDAARQARLAGALSRFAGGREVQMTFAEDPELLAGVRVRLAGCVLDGSLAGRIARAVRCAAGAAEECVALQAEPSARNEKEE